MDIQYFPHFIRKNFPEVPGNNEQFIEIGEEFKSYLLETFKGNEDNLEKIWDISPAKVIFASDSPLKVNGYHPALVLHFTEFIAKMKKEITSQEEKNGI